MATQPVFSADAPNFDPSELAMLNTGVSPQATAAAQRSQDLAQALVAMRDQVNDIRTPDASIADRLADALMQRTYGQSMQDFAQPARPDPLQIAWPALSGPDQPSGGQLTASAPAVTRGPTADIAGVQAGPGTGSDHKLYPADAAADGAYSPPGYPGLFVNGLTFDDLIPGRQAHVPRGGAANFVDLIPNAGAPRSPSYSGAGPLYSGQTFGNAIAAGTTQDNRPDRAQSVLPPVGQQGASYLPAKFPRGSVVPEPVGAQLSPAVRSYLLPPGTPVDALGNPSPVTFISSGAGNMTIDTYPGATSIFPPVPAPLLTPGASIRSHLDNASQASYLVSANGSSTSYSPLTFLPGAIGIASAKPGDAWGGVPLTAGDIAAAQRFIAWADTPFVRQNPYLGQIWNGYGFEPSHSGLDQAQKVFAAEKSALDKQYGWMALPAMLPLAIASAPTLASGLNTVGAWAGSQASAWVPSAVGGLGLAGAAAVRREEESAPSAGESLGAIAARDATEAAEGVAPDVYPDGSFSITDWEEYPEGLPKPEGPFRLLEGDEYIASRNAANQANRAMHAADPSLDGLQIHEIQPVKFGGSPTDPLNKISLTQAEHTPATTWWYQLWRDLWKN